jgi:Reverse transcriptase (RNA-dependent DNA polymerase)
MAVYVDDILVAGTDIASVEYEKSLIRKNFEVHDMGEASNMIRWEICRNQNGIRITQEKYARSILLKFSNTDGYSHKFLIVAGALLHASLDGIDEPVEITPYRSAVGLLLYLSSPTRPDLCFVVSLLSRFLTNPCKRHNQMLLRVFGYLRGVICYGLFFPMEYKNDFHSIIYSDADLGGPELNSVSIPSSPCCKSISGYTLLLFGCAIIFKS